MQRFKLQSILKFQWAIATLMLATLVFVWTYNQSVKRLDYDIERTTRANHILQGYQELSMLTSRELRAMGGSVLQGDRTTLSEWGPGASALRESVSTLRRDIAEEVAFRGSGDEAKELEQVLEIERQVEEIIRSSELIERALNEGITVDARNELERLQNSGFADNFNTLVNSAIADQTIKSQSVDRESNELIRYFVELAPVLMTALLLIGIFLNFVFSRNLTRSVSALHKAVLAFRNGDLTHRIPKLSDKDFQRMGATFNAMARQLSEQREQLQDTNVQLEAMVVERTHELQESNRKLAAADVNRRKLLVDISHEFRTPLTVMRGEAEIALRGSNKTMEDHRESFRRIVDQAVNATQLVDDLLFIARADAGEPRFKIKSVSIASVIDSVCIEFAIKAKEKGVKIEQGRLAAGAVVQGDLGRLRQVFTILLDNAIKYSNHGGRIKIQVLQEKGTVAIIFRDDGIGLEEEESELAFKRFYRAPTAVEKAAGTGLGLPVAKAIVEAHNGTISLRGKPGQGSTATVVLPFGREFGTVT